MPVTIPPDTKPMNKLADQYRKLLYPVYEVFLSLYCSFLIAWVEESSPFAVDLRVRILFFWHPRSFPLPTTDYVLFALELILIPAAVIFAGSRLLGFFPFGRTLLHLMGGIVGVAGFPLAVIVSCFGNAYLRLPVSELPIAALCFFLWMYRKWPLSAPLNVLLVVFHFAVWSFAGSNYGNWFAAMWRHGLFVVPALGLCYTVLWAAYFRQSQRGLAQTSAL